MFSQFRTAVEQLAQQPRRPTPSDAPSTSTQHDHSGSTNSQGTMSSLSSGQVTDTAITNLRKSLAAQQSSSPKPVVAMADQTKPRSRLEERLRASLSFTIGDASNSTTPEPSTRATPTIAPPPQSPSSILLPDSPVNSPGPDGRVLSPPPEDMARSPPDIQHLAQPTPVRADAETTLVAETLEAAVDTMSYRYTEADVPLPESPVEELIREPVPDSVPVSDSNASGVDVESLRQQLKLFKERFADVSSSFKRLQAEKFAVDSVLQELTPLQSMRDPASLREYIENMSSQVEMSQDEIKRLNGKLVRQEERIEELRETHRMESQSQSDQIVRLQKQVEETEAILKASQTIEINRKDESEKAIVRIEKLKAETEKFKTAAAQEEEKRAKAIALLKTVRQKLVKTEKERDDMIKDVNDLKEKDKVERTKEKAERQKLQQEIERENLEREKAVSGLKAQFDRELNNLRDRQEKDMLAVTGQFELEMVSRQNTYAKESEARNQRILVLETSVQNLTQEKDAIFDQLQMRQAELESSQAHMESLQSQTTEYQYQIRELEDRTALLTEELAEAQIEHKNSGSQPAISAEDVTRLLSNAEAKYEARLADLRKQLDTAERERNDADAEWSSKFSAKAIEVEELKRTINSSVRNKTDHEQTVVQLWTEVERLKDDIRTHQKHSVELQQQAEKVQEVEDTAKLQIADSIARNTALEKQIEEAKAREAQLRTSNKTLREELRKVQSSAALLEKQRNPGLGYWASRDNVTGSRTSISSTSDHTSPVESTSRSDNDEEVNLEYLRNVVLQFLEHKEMRPNLVRVLTTILRFTPQETRRLSRSL